ncbi:Structural maintenance of chromosomes protein 5 [Ascosphaera acerosa]|nr:Structural maintenance of chromosomes protein 5 [Ascosphaera acerosa]
MPSASRRRRADETSDDNDTPSPHTKRVKIEGEYDSQTADGRSGASQTELPVVTESDRSHNELSERKELLAAQPSSSKSDIKHSPGAIVRVRLTDFVTYSSAEFHPGPLLNMIIGPNGTGKSTFVCAVCLGLGWGSQVLGRAKDVADFVKHGRSKAAIEIELQGRPGNPNPVIKRVIRKDGSKNAFFINGQTASQKQILELARSYSIQIDNLCQFLPQDKVAEFAAMTPVELLKSTQRAAAPPQMLQWHDELIDLRKNQKEALTHHTAHQELLTNLERRHDLQREDVDRMRQRDEIKKRIHCLELYRPLIKYKDLAQRTLDARADVEERQKEAEDLHAQVAPILQSAEDKKRYCGSLEIVVRQRRTAVTAAVASAENARDQAKDLEGALEALKARYKTEKQRGQSIREERQKWIQQKARIERQLEEEPPEFNPASYNERLRDLVRQMRGLEDQRGDVKAQRDQANDDYRQKNREIERAEHRYRNLESQAGRQEEKLLKLSSDTYQAYQWIKGNKAKFEHDVFGPPIIECSLRDLRYADIVESTFGRSDLQAFTTQSPADFRTMQRAFADHRWQDVTIRTCSLSLNQLRTPLSDDEVKGLGFDCWVRDLLSGPDAVLAMLSSELNLHAMPVTLRDMSDSEYRALESHPRISSWASGSNLYSVTRRREYGPGATSTRVRNVRRAQWWTNQPVDSGAKLQLEQYITQAREQLTEVEKQLEETLERDRQFAAEIKELQTRERTLKAEKDEKQKAAVYYRGLPDKKANVESKLQAVENQGRDLRKTLLKIRKKQVKTALAQAQAAIEYATCVGPLRQAVEHMFEAEVRLEEGRSDLETLNARNHEVNDALTEKRRLVEEAQALFAQLNTERRRAKRAAEAFQGDIAGTEKEAMVREMASVVQAFTPAQLEAEIESDRARLALISEGSADIIEEFEARQFRIDRLRHQIAEETTVLEEVDDAIRTTRAEWEPRLDALVAQISSAFFESFARIGCAGQVTIDKAEESSEARGGFSDQENGSGSDFDRWAIQIMVKFRESEPLSVLDAHRQSGGERAVSTIFYLMALQSLSKSPFRVVDEINQGMDPRNERMVHERMVNIACDEAEGTGRQYFLITPKLLTGLAYREGMQVSCVLSGEYMPDEYDKTSAARCLEKMSAFLRQRGALVR